MAKHSKRVYVSGFRAPITPAAMHWTTEKPKCNGYYWAKVEPGAVAEVVCVELPLVWRTSSTAELAVEDFSLFSNEPLNPPSVVMKERKDP